ncbi:g9965 [Coccomyxa viridis]|uniref:Transmembrane 9 superfamily member n=1 Tax=Coccomyxa viridis TaxID=1274662 RepID=A0ABP1G5K6_9CHLO
MKAVVALLLAGLSGVLCGRAFEEGAPVKLYANKVGPFSNPSETYQYYDLPFCRPEGGLEHKPETLGEVVDGNRLIMTPYDLSFRKDKVDAKLCTKTLTQNEIMQLRKAVSDDFYFQMYYDNLPIWGFIGKLEKEVNSAGGESKLKHYVFTHVHFDIAYNGNRIVEINVSTDPAQMLDLSEDVVKEDKPVEVTFTYSVQWRETDTPYEKRMDKYRRYQFLPQHLEIHWFSIINSCVTVLLLTGFLATILMRVLKNDFIKYTRDDDVLDETEESGWKNIHGEVFRFPPNKNLFCAFVGSGFQLLALSIFIFGLACVGVFYPYNRGGLYTALIVLYALTAGIAGYIAGSYYKQMDGRAWVRNILLTSVTFCGPLFIVFCINNTVAISYRSTAALPFGTIVIILLIWALITIPLTVAGGIIGKNTRTEFKATCRTNKYPREIPELPWYRHTVPQMVMAGFLPFSAIYIELYYIFASVWGHKVYTIYSILFIVFIILLIVTAFITVALTYFQLAVEDHRWWWRSFLCGGSTGLFIYGYCIYYYFFRSDMSGTMQSAFFFLYNGTVCLAFFLMLGTVGWRSSLSFVRHIYSAIKSD